MIDRIFAAADSVDKAFKEWLSSDTKEAESRRTCYEEAKTELYALVRVMRDEYRRKHDNA